MRYKFNSKIVCRLFGTKCNKCGLGFTKNDFVMRARNKIYHIECFKCVACSKQLIPGDEFALREDGLFCKADHDVVERNCLVGDVLSEFLGTIFYYKHFHCWLTRRFKLRSEICYYQKLIVIFIVTLYII